MKRSLATLLVTIISSQSLYANGLANRVFESKRYKNLDVISMGNSERVVNDRRKQAQGSADRANTGGNIHIATGATLIATGSAMIASTVPPVVVAGVITLTKGIIETVQGAVDKAVSRKNRSEENRLKLTYDNSTGQNVNANSNSASSLISPDDVELSDEARNFLAQKGMNPNDLIRQVISGEISSPEELAQASGHLNGFSQDVIQKGLAMAESGEGMLNAPSDKLTLGYTEDRGLASIGGPAGSISPEGLKEVGAGEGDTHGATDFSAGVAAAKAESVPVDDKTPNSLDSVLGKFFPQGAIDGAKDAQERIAMMQDILLGNGITASKARQNIFQMAHRNYRGWGTWRSK